MTVEPDLSVEVRLSEPKEPPPPPAAKDPGDQYRAAVDRYREAAKWAVGAFGGIGALVVASLPLTQLGAGTATDPVQTIWGTVLALGGVTLAIAAVLAVLAPRSVFSFELVARKRKLPARLVSGKAAMEDMLHRHGNVLLPNGIKNVPDLTAGIDNLDAVIGAASKDSSSDAPGVQALKRRQALMVETLKHLTWIARVEKMRAAFRVSSALILTAGVAVGLGLGLLFDALYDDSSSDKAEAEVAKLDAEVAKLDAEKDKLLAEAGKIRAETPATPADAGTGSEATPLASTPSVDVFLNRDGVALLPDCATEPGSALPGLLLPSASEAGWNVVVLPTDTCAGGQLLVTPSLGTVR